MKKNTQLKMLFLDDDAQEPTRFALIEDVLEQAQGDLFEDDTTGDAPATYRKED